MGSVSKHGPQFKKNYMGHNLKKLYYQSTRKIVHLSSQAVTAQNQSMLGSIWGHSRSNLITKTDYP